MHIYEFFVLRVLLLSPTIYAVYTSALTLRPRENTAAPECFSACLGFTNIVAGVEECQSADYVCICSSTKHHQYLIDCIQYRCSNQADFDVAIQNTTALCDSVDATTPSSHSIPLSPSTIVETGSSMATSSNSTSFTSEHTGNSNFTTPYITPRSSNDSTSDTGNNTSPPPGTPQDSPATAPIAGGVAGGVVAILIAFACFYWRDKIRSAFRRRDRPNEPAWDAPIQASKPSQLPEPSQPPEILQTSTSKPPQPPAHMPVPIFAPTPRPFQTPGPPQTPAPTNSLGPYANAQPPSNPPE